MRPPLRIFTEDNIVETITNWSISFLILIFMLILFSSAIIDWQYGDLAENICKEKGFSHNSIHAIFLWDKEIVCSNDPETLRIPIGDEK